jgi:methyltransferase-like protein
MNHHQNVGQTNNKDKKVIVQVLITVQFRTYLATWHLKNAKTEIYRFHIYML